MKWIITKDHISSPEEGEQSAVNTRNGCTIDEGWELPAKFRLYDDDGILYYEGRASEDDFGPLDWASTYAGCTELRYLKGDTWHVL